MKLESKKDIKKRGLDANVSANASAWSGTSNARLANFSGVMRNIGTARLKWIREERFGAKTTG